MKFHHRHHRKQSRIQELMQLRKETLEKIEHLSKKAGKSLPEEKKSECMQDFFDLIKAFFAKYLGVHHHSTYEEISREIGSKRVDSRIKRRTEKFMQKLIHVEYANIELSKERTRMLFNEFKYLVEKYIAYEAAEEKDLLIYPKKLFSGWITKSKEKRAMKAKIKKKQDYDDSITQIKNLLIDAKKALRKEEKETAFNIYKQIEYLCYGLKKEDVEKVYDRLFLIYRKNHPIYVLMSKAKAAFKNKDAEGAKRIYVELKEYFENLPESRQDEFYDGIFSLFKPKAMHEIYDSIDEGYYHLAKKDVKKTKAVYEKIRQQYKELPENERKEIYEKMMSFYSDIRAIFSS